MDPYTDDPTKKKTPEQGIAAVPTGPAPNVYQGRQIAAAPPAAAAAPSFQSTITPEIAQGGVDLVRNNVNAATTAARGTIASDLNPMSAMGELQNRLSNALDARGGNKGSPMARQMQAQAIMAQMGANTQAGIAGIQPIASAALAGQAQMGQGQLMAQQGTQAGALAEQQGNTQLTAGRQQNDAAMALENVRQAGESSRLDTSIAGNIDIAKIGKGPAAAYQRGADGTVSLIEGTSAKPVTTADGNPFNAQDAVSAADRFKAYNERSAQIDNMIGTPEAKQQARDALKSDPQFAPLFQNPAAAPAAKPAQGGAKPANASAFIQAMRAQGSKLSDAELTAYFNQTYGAQK